MSNQDPPENKILVLHQGEVNALIKAIEYLKFSCEEIDSCLYAGSPLINSALTKLIEIDDYSEFSKQFYRQKHPANEQFIRAKMERWQEGNHLKLDEEIKRQSFREELYPFSSE